MTTLWQRNSASVAIICLLLAAGQARANPIDPTVIAGQASFSTQGNSLDITNTPGTVINWQGFSIGADQTTQFIQQNAASSVLNRVMGPDPSTLLGTLTSNGRVFLINPSGIVVGEGARIDVAGLVASTLNLSNEDFAANRLNFLPDPSAGTVENHGTIVTPSGGSVYLVGSSISSSGLISSPQGDVILAAGESARIFDSSTPGVRVEVTGNDNLAVNLGEIVAKSGEVGIYASAFRNAGMINADQVVRDASGKIVLRATQDITLEAGSDVSATGEQAGTIVVQSETGTNLVSGKIDASSTGTEQTGGSVTVLGDKVGLIGGHIDASGDAGGGTVLVGGDLYGANPEVQNATATYMSADSTVTSDAVIDGPGGTVVLWSDGPTRAYGSISARGGAQSGDGGLIETSGTWLDVSDIDIDAGAPNGNRGTWLLDPSDVTITSSTSGGSFSGGDPNLFSPAPSASTSTVNVATIVTSLNAGTDVSIISANESGTGAGDITVASAITWTSSPVGSILTLDAVRDVNVNAAITATNGSFVTIAERDVNVNAAVTITDGDFIAKAANDLFVAAAITLTRGNLLLRADDDGTGPGALGGTVAFTGPGAVTLETGSTAEIFYNPVSYDVPTDYSTFFSGVGTMESFMWVFAEGDNKVYDGLTDASLSFVGDPTIGGDVTLDSGTANFDTKDVGTGKTITYSGYTLGGVNANEFALFYTDVPGAGTTTADITPKALTAVDLTSTVTKVYDGDASVDNLTTGNYSITGFIPGEGATIGVTSGTYDNGKDVVNNPAGSPVTSAILAAGDYTATGTTLLSNYDLTAVTGVSATAAIGEITAAPLTATVANQTKIYGADDPALASIGVTLGGLVVDDSTLTSTATDLTRDAGETVDGSLYAITAGTFTTPSTNYSAPTLVLGSTLDITPAPLTATVADQTKIYGDDDPALAGIGVTLTGLINDPTINTWNGDVAVDDSTLTSTTTDLTREVGETVAGSLYAITAGTFTTPTTNYSAPTLVLGSTLDITPAPLTATVDDQTKIYGDDDPALGGIGVTLTGLINDPTITTWNGDVAVDDSTLNSTATDLTRDAGETVAGSLYAITAGTFTTPTTNYSAPTLVLGSTLDITPAPLTATVADQTKVYGDDDPALAGIGITLTGLINDPAITTWNGDVAVNDSTLTTTAIDLTRDAGETVSGSLYAITAGTFTTPTTNYSAPTLVLGSTLDITPAPLTATVADQTKIYGDDDPALAGIGVTLTGLINNPAITTWNGDVAVDDSTLTSTAADLTRDIGETVAGSLYAITAGTFTTPSTNYSSPTLVLGSTLDITPAPLTATVADQTKVYGDDDPALAGIGITLTGLINDPAITTWNGDVAVNDSTLTTTATDLTRDAGETVAGSLYAITAGTFTTPTTNYSAPTLVLGSTLDITPAPLTATVADQTKIYGDDDPALAGIGVTLTGLINDPTINTWNGDVAVDDSTLTSTATDLTRDAGETVAGSLYAITAGTFTTPTTNYSAPTLVLGSTLDITPAPLTATVDDQTKIYGDDDPALAGIGVTLTGLINDPTINTWNGDVAVDDSTLTSTTASDLTRDAGETVAGSLYAITAGTFTTPSTNYSAPTLVLGSTLDITPAPLTATVADQTKVYGDDDPALAGIGVTLTGLINDPTITTWNGDVAVDDSTLTSTTTDLTRDAGETVAGSLYAITAGTFTTPTANYSAPTLVLGSTLDITPATLTATVADQTKIYGDDDPALAGTGVTLAGLINDPTITTWNGDVAVDDSTLTTTATDLTREVGETVAGSLYAITAGTFTAPSTNYSVPTLVLGSTLAITPKTVNLAATRTYDGTTDFVEGSFTSTITGTVSNTSWIDWNGNIMTVLGAQTLSIASGGTGTVPSKNAGPAQTMTTGTIALADGSNGGLATNYTLIGGTHSGTITPKALTAVDLTGAVTKVYDGDASVDNLTTGNHSITGFIAGEGATIGVTSGTYDNGKDVVNNPAGSPVTSAVLAAGDYTATGTTLLSNYDLTAVTGVSAKGTIGEITPAGLALSGTRVYDATTVFAGDNLIANGIAGESFTVTGAGDSTNLASKHVQTGSTLASVTGLALGTSGDGGLASNYKAITTTASSVDVTARPVTLTAPSVTKTYDGLLGYITTADDLNTITLSGPLAGTDTVSVATIAYTDNNAGTNNKTVNLNSATIDDGNSGNNYTVTLAGNTTSTITALAITGDITANDKIYDATDGATIATRTLTGVIGTDDVSYVGGTALFDDKNVGIDKTVTGTALSLAGTDAGNYTVNSTALTTADITPAPLGIAANSTSKIYGDTVSFTGGEFSSTGLKNGETVGSVSLASAGVAATAGVASNPYDITPSAATGGTFSASNYTITYIDGALGVIPAPLGIAANSTSKTFGETVNFTGTEFSSTGLKNGETIGSVSLASLGAVADAGVDGSPYDITISAATGGTFDAGNYTISYVDGSLGVIAAGLLGIAANAAAKTYDGLAFSGGNGVNYTGFQAGDTADSLDGTLVYGGTSQGAVDVGEYTIIPSGQSSPNYTITYVNGTLSVIPAPLGIAANSATRLYGDANPAFSATYTGFQNGETPAVLTGTLALTTPAIPASNVGSYAIIPSGQSSTNYTITYVNGSLGVLPVPLIVTADAQSKVYGTSDPALTFGATGLVNNPALGVVDTIENVFSGALTRTAGETVLGGPYAITQGTLATNSNYTLSSFTANNLSILPASLDVAANPQSKVYGTSDPALTFSTTGLVNNPALGIADTADSVLSGTLTRVSGETVLDGPYAITQGSLAANSNYNLSSFTGNALGITPLDTTVSGTRIYDQTTDAAGSDLTTISALIAGDTVTVDGTGSVADKHVEVDKAISNGTLALAGADAGNYNLLDSGNILTIKQLDTTVSGTRNYDQTTDVAGSDLTTITALIAGDKVTVDGTGSVADKHVEEHKAVSTGTMALTGDDARNYKLLSSGNTLSIAPLDTTGAITAADKIYDATEGTMILTRSLTGVLAGDDVTYVGGTALFDDKNVGTAKTVTATLLSLAGADAGNYTVNTTALTTADIVPLKIIGDITADDKIYDGTDTADILTRTLTGVLGTDEVTYVGGTALFDDKNVGTGKTVTAKSLSLDGTDAGNYTVNTTALTTADITPLTITGDITADDKIYDATDTADILNRTLTGVLGTDDVNYVGGTALFDDKNVGLDKTVTAKSLSLAGTDAGNYTVNSTAFTTTDIMPAPLEVVADPKSKIFGADDPPLTFSVTGLISNPALGIDETADLVLSGALTRAPGESVLDGPYAITRGTLTSNNNYAIDFTGNLFVIIGAAEEPVLGFNAVQFLFAEVTNNVSYYQPGNFWHISLNPNNADPGFDVMRGTEELKSRTNRCDSVSGAGYCETWSFPQQSEEIRDVE